MATLLYEKLSCEDSQDHPTEDGQEGTSSMSVAQGSTADGQFDAQVKSALNLQAIMKSEVSCRAQELAWSLSPMNPTIDVNKLVPFARVSSR